MRAAAHITGGGLPGNLPRVLPDGLVAVVDRAWPVPPVFGWLARAGKVAEDELLRVFNCGIGMVLVVSDPQAALAALAELGETAYPIGRVEAGSGGGAVWVAGWLVGVSKEGRPSFSRKRSKKLLLLRLHHGPARFCQHRSGRTGHRAYAGAVAKVF